MGAPGLSDLLKHEKTCSGVLGVVRAGHCLTLLLPPCQNEKELQDVVKQQEEKLLQLIDKSGEVMVCDGGMGEQLPRGLLATGPLSAFPFFPIEAEGRSL